MKKVLAITLIFLCSIAFSQSIVPENDFYPGWKRSDKLRTFTAPSLFQHINGGADLFLEFGFDTLFVQRYALEDSELGLEIYRMKSAESALGVYLLKCGRETSLEGIAARHSYDPFQTTMLRGAYFIQIINYDGETALNPAVIALANQVLDQVPAEQPDQSLMARLPSGYIPGSLRLIRGQVALEPIYTLGNGDILGLGGRHFLVMADYGRKAGVISRMIIDYPDQREAESVMSVLNTDLDPYLEKLKVSDNSIIFRDFMDRFGKIWREGARLNIMLHLTAMPERP